MYSMKIYLRTQNISEISREQKFSNTTKEWIGS